MKTRKSIIRGSLILALTIASSNLFTSCGDGKELSESNAKKALKEMVALKDSSLTVPLTMGYFEIPSEEVRLAYRQLAKAGVINYKMEIIVDQETKGGWYSSYTVDVPHYFVAASLTEEGKKYIVFNPVKEEEDKDLKEKEDETVYPEAGDYPSDLWKQATNAEPTNIIDEEDESPAGSSYSDSSKDSAPKTPYQQALKKVSKQEYNFLTAFVKINKVREIRCNEVEGEAKAEVIYEFDKITPFGRICSDIKKGKKYTLNASFTRYSDKGWKAENIKD